MRMSMHRSWVLRVSGIAALGVWLVAGGCGSNKVSGGAGGDAAGGSGSGGSGSGGDGSGGSGSGGSGSGGSGSGGDAAGGSGSGGSGSGGSGSGGSGAGGSSAGGGTGSTTECTGTALPSASITDFSTAEEGTTSITLGSVGGIFIYPTTSGPTGKVEDGALHVTASLPANPSTNYWGFGIYFATCTDASAYSGVKFKLKGTTNCPMKFGVNMSVDDKDSGEGKAGCTGTCYGPNAPIAATEITSDGKDVTITFEAMGGGAPVTTVGSHKAALTGIQWQFASADACTADVTVDDVVFVQ